MKSEKQSRELRQLSNDFVEYLSRGDTAAIKKMLADAAIEKAAAETFHYVFVDMEQSGENLIATGIVNEFTDEIDVVNFAAGTAKDYVHAVERYDHIHAMHESVGLDS